VFETFGDATNETRYSVCSATKPIVASAIWILIGELAVDVRQRVATYIPEFATHGKDEITVEQVMLHTSGFPYADIPLLSGATSEGRTQAFAGWKLDWDPGSTYEYHGGSAHWVLAEIIERVTGRDFRDFIQERVTRPAGISTRVLGVPAAEQNDIAALVNVGHPPTPDELEAELGVRELPTEGSPGAVLALNSPDVREVGVPSGGGIMSAADLAIFYQALLHNPGGIWDDVVLRDAVGTVRSMVPERWSGIPASRALGVVVAGDDGHRTLRGFGTTGSPRSFGHGGAGGQIAWVDPDSGLSFAYATNGFDQHTVRRDRRGIALSSVATECSD
jgi:CubicO group peptidase (beta-lactamase class C family)